MGRGEAEDVVSNGKASNGASRHDGTGANGLGHGEALVDMSSRFAAFDGVASHGDASRTSRLLRGISSMAMRPLLVDLVQAVADDSKTLLHNDFAGGVDVARRIATGEAVDLVFLAADAMQRLADSGHVMGHTVRPIANASVAIAARVGASRLDVSSEAALREAVLAAPRIGLSTGPSGDALLGLFDRWGLGDALTPRVVKPPPGVPIAELLAEARVDLGFQQRSELLGRDGIELLGPMPPGLEIVTTFVGAVSTRSPHPAPAVHQLEMLAGAITPVLLERHGLEPAARLPSP